jgi:hypothetical protein
MVAVEEWRQSPTGSYVQAGDIAFTSRGTGATLRGLYTRDQDLVWVTDFMTEAEQADCYAGTMLYDHQPAIQKAIDYAVYRNAQFAPAGGPRVRMPGGVLRIDRPVNVTYGNDFRSAMLEGEGDKFGGQTNENGAGTVIYTNFTDAPGVVVQGGRNVVLRDFSVLGQNMTWVVDKVFEGDHSMADLEPEAWVDPALPADALSRYAPYCGIAIDPYSGVRPGTSYPDVPYPAFLGVVPQYGKGFSGNTLIENVSVWGFPVGIVQQPCAADGNGDFTKLRRVFLRFGAYGFAWGNTQARAQHLEDSIVSCVHTGLATGVFGEQHGNPQITVTACSFDCVIKMHDIPTLNYGQGPLYQGCFAEAIYSIGSATAGNALNSGGMTFEACELGFSWWARYGVPAAVCTFSGALGVARFSQVYFYLGDGNGGFLVFDGGPPNAAQEVARSYAIEGCTVDGQEMDLAGNAYRQCAFNATMGIAFAYGSTCLSGTYSCGSGYIYNLDTGVAIGPMLYSEAAEGPRVRCLPVYSKKIRALNLGRDPGYDVAWGNVAITATTVTATVGKRVTFTAAAVTTANLMVTGGDVGDLLWCQQTGAMFVVRSRTTTSIQVEAVSGYDDEDELLTPVPNGAAMWAVNCRRYSLDAVVYGDFTYESATITSVTNGSGGYPNMNTQFVVGDYLYQTKDVWQVFNTEQCNIVSVDNGAKSITLGAAGGASDNWDRQRISLWVRPAMANAA